MGRLSLAAILVAAVVVSGAVPAPPTIPSLFGSRVSENTRFKAPYLTADLDGDGAADTVYLVSIAAASPRAIIAPDVAVISRLFHSQPLGAHEEKLAIAIVFASGKQKLLVTGYQGEGVSGFFSSPIWSEKSVPLSAAKRGSQTFMDFQKQEKRIRNDILVIGTEAGIDVALYWDGKTFVLFEPDEEP